MKRCRQFILINARDRERVEDKRTSDRLKRLQGQKQLKETSPAAATGKTVVRSRSRKQTHFFILWGGFQSRCERTVGSLHPSCGLSPVTWCVSLDKTNPPPGDQFGFHRDETLEPGGSFFLQHNGAGAESKPLRCEDILRAAEDTSQPWRHKFAVLYHVHSC
ncbi:hypothetical protein INR49_018002 [Caranx melampygus]|nr:hypothetical protein INR49_018002 [Caranx melampygus]